MTLEVTLSAVVPLLVGLLNLLVAVYAVTFGVRRAEGTEGRRAMVFAAPPAAVGVWALAWFVSTFDASALPSMQKLGAVALLFGVAGALFSALADTTPRRRRSTLIGVVGAAVALAAVVALVIRPESTWLRLGLATRALSLAGMGGVAMVAAMSLRDPAPRAARRTLMALAGCAAVYLALAVVSYARGAIAVDVMLFVVLALELLSLVAILEGRVRVEVLVARAITYAVLAVVVAGVAAVVFSRLGYEVDPVTVSATVAISLVASALFMGLSDPLTRGITQALFPEHARLEAALAASQAELDGLRRQLARAERLALAGELAASVAHEIKNPLAPVRGYAQMLEGKLESVEATERALFAKGLGIIRKEADRVDARVRELLDLASAAPDVDPEASFLLSEVLKDVLLVAEAEPGVTKVDLRIAEPGVRVLGDAEGVRGALVNLLKNSAEAMEAARPGRIEVEVEAGSEEVLVHVRDEGPGLPETAEDKAFDAFYTTKQGGTGLGLSIARTAVMAAGGHIELAPRADRVGAWARVQLLRAEEAK